MSLTQNNTEETTKQTVERVVAKALKAGIKNRTTIWNNVVAEIGVGNMVDQFAVLGLICTKGDLDVDLLNSRINERAKELGLN